VCVCVCVCVCVFSVIHKLDSVQQMLPCLSILIANLMRFHYYLA
jgi:hypothetical protein